VSRLGDDHGTVLSYSRSNQAYLLVGSRNACQLRTSMIWVFSFLTQSLHDGYIHRRNSAGLCTKTTYDVLFRVVDGNFAQNDPRLALTSVNRLQMEGAAGAGGRDDRREGAEVVTGTDTGNIIPGTLNNYREKGVVAGL
jgi:hypothetical protein